MCKKINFLSLVWFMWTSKTSFKSPIKNNGRVFTCLEVLQKWEALRAGNLKEDCRAEWMSLFNCRWNCSGDLSLGANTDLKDVENYLLSHFSCWSVFALRKTKLPWSIVGREARSRWQFRKCWFWYSRCQYLYCRDWGAGKCSLISMHKQK